MTAKMQAAWMAAQQGVTTIIANGKASDSLLQVRVQFLTTYIGGSLTSVMVDCKALLLHNRLLTSTTAIDERLLTSTTAIDKAFH